MRFRDTIARMASQHLYTCTAIAWSRASLQSCQEIPMMFVRAGGRDQFRLRASRLKMLDSVEAATEG